MLGLFENSAARLDLDTFGEKTWTIVWVEKIEGENVTVLGQSSSFRQTVPQSRISPLFPCEEAKPKDAMLDAMNVGIRKEIESLYKENASLREHINSTNAEIATLRNDNAGLGVAVDYLRSEKGKALDSLDEKIKENAGLKNEIEVREEEVNRLRSGKATVGSSPAIDRGKDVYCKSITGGVWKLRADGLCVYAEESPDGKLKGWMTSNFSYKEKRDLIKSGNHFVCENPWPEEEKAEEQPKEWKVGDECEVKHAGWRRGKITRGLIGGYYGCGVRYLDDGEMPCEGAFEPKDIRPLGRSRPEVARDLIAEIEKETQIGNEGKTYLWNTKRKALAAEYADAREE